MTIRHSTGRPSALARCAVLGALFGAALLAGAARSKPVTIGGPFTLTAPDGTSVSERTYAGKWLLVYFGFINCPVTCPTALIEIATALDRLGPDTERLRALFITLDPERDTPAVMRDYTSSFDPRITGLTGTPEQIAAVVREYGVYAVVQRTGPEANDYTIDHSTYLYLMGPDGGFVRGFDAETSGEQMAAVIRGLVAGRRDLMPPAPAPTMGTGPAR